jgi:RHS repeat-associated protein
MRTKSMLAGALSVVLAVGLAGTGRQPAVAAEPEVRPTPSPRMPSVPGRAVPVETPAPDQATEAAKRPVPQPVWPQGTSAVTATTSGGKSVRAQVLDRAAAQAAGVNGLLVRVDGLSLLGADQEVKLSIDYSGLRNLYGGDWASRLQLVDLADRTVLRSANNVAAGQLSATVESGAVGSMLAVTADTGGAAGDFKATELSAAGQWSVNAQSGGFTWSYELRTPPVPGDLAPSLSLSYSSAAVDGRTASTNNQPSWLGEGWGLWPGYVERSYRNCSETEGKPKTGDLCWVTENAVMSLGGKTMQLVREGTTRRWRPETDDGTRVEQRFDKANGDVRGEHWVVTTTDGVQYHYGSQPAAQSTWTVPVFGDSPGEGCGGTFATSDCVRAWRWNLDFVVDTNGNTINYQYRAETNRYARNQTDASVATYHRGGWLERIDYGGRAGEPAAAQVAFAVADRCRPGATCSQHTGAAWPDVPWDWECTTATCADKYSPTFWSTKRLASVTTRVRSGTAYADVDRWTFDQIYPDPGDGTSAALWLQGITHTGLVGGSASQPPVTFAGTARANRVDSPTDGPPQLFKYRIETVHNGTGGDINVEYAPTNCSRAALPSPATNTLRCFPARWQMSPEPEPRDDWFHLYVVNRVTLNDAVAGAMTEVFDYDYLGGGAWRYDDNPVTAEKFRTWSLWRGYEKVQVRHGDPAREPQRPVSLTQYTYFRGMHGDRATPTGGTKTAQVTDSEGTSLVDSEQLSGVMREQITYNGAGGAVVTGVIHDPWTRLTATQGSRQAFQVETRRTVTRTGLASGGLRRTQVDTTFDNEGNPTEVNDLGDLATAADDRCTRTDYARNEATWLLNLPSRVSTVGVACGGTASYPADAISDERTYYDGLALDAAPTAGNPTKAEEAQSYSGSTPSYVTVSTSTYDAYGRVLDAVDAEQRKTTSRYTPATGPATSSTVTNPAEHPTTITLNPAWGLPVAIVHPNQSRTDLTYDPLGRLTGAWLPGRLKTSLPDQPSLRYGYAVQDKAPTRVRTDTLGPNGNYITSFAWYDGFMRPRRTQAPSPQGGWVLNETAYDSRGLAYLALGPYYREEVLETTMVEPDLNRLPTMTMTRFDGAERPVEEIYLPFNEEPADGRRWRTTTEYGGDHVKVTPPTGATATATFSDARGQTTELRQYPGATPTGTTFDTTRYGYNDAGELTRLTDPAGNIWRYDYDVRGRQTLVVDPDAGQTVMTYDRVGQLLTTTDARGEKITYDYDELGRKFQSRSGDTVLAKWTYDTLQPGLLTSSTRFQAGGEYTRTVTGYDPAGRPTGQQVSFPGAEIGATGTASFTTTMTYWPDGSLNLLRLPEISTDVPAEALTHTYDALGMLTTLKSNTANGTATYLNRATYTALGEPDLIELGDPQDGPHVWQRWSYEASTRRLANTVTEREQAGNLLVEALSYAYDPAGNMTSIKDELPGVTVDNQCFGYDYLRRLTEAWTPTSDCTATPSAATTGGPAPYWHSYRYDPTGNRKSLNRHGLAGASDTVSTYSYPDPGQPRPHAVTSVQTTAAGTATYDYNATGHTISRPGPTSGAQQTLTWDTEGRLASIGSGTATTSYRYDADGTQLIRRDPTTVTVFLGDDELVYDTTTRTKTATRYYRAGGRTIAVRAGGTLQWLVGDHHGTNQLTVDPTTLQATTRRTDPFGNPRGPAPTWQGGNRGFVGGTPNQATGLTRLGAREYDPTTGKFISVDPVIDTKDPQQMNAYAYAKNNPITWSDPTGLIPDSCGVDVKCYGYNPNSGCPHGCGTKANKKWGEEKAAKKKRRQEGAGVPPDRPPSAEALAHSKAQYDWQGMKFDWGYLKKHGVPHPATNLRVYLDINLTGEILDRCAVVTGDIDCDPDFRSAIMDQYFRLKGFEGGTAEVVAGGLLGGGGGRGGRGGRGGLRGGCSFSADTPVLMAHGKTKPIGEIQVGDEVMATDPETGKRGPRKVTHVWVHDDRLADLLLEDGATVATTEDHLFWNATDRQWQRADKLGTGESLLGPHGQHQQVVGIRQGPALPAPAYTLTIADLHTYYVLAGWAPVLVHNCPDDIPARSGRARPVTDFSAADQTWKDLGYSSRGAFGKDVWGTGEAGAKNFMHTMTRGRLEEIGLTRRQALLWRDAYATEFAANPKNGTAGARASLMEHYANLLS